jgi:hypothetical protein
MRVLMLFVALLGISSCGGGGGGSKNNSVPISPASDPKILTSTRVIDGYIEGANVYIDFNWNLEQDEGEPSAEADEDGVYNYPYEDGEFAAIADVSIECAEKRIQVAEVPVGAIDADRGAIDEAFTMYFVPSNHVPGNNPLGLEHNLLNISPFSGIFLDIVAQARDALNITSIDVKDGCGVIANELADRVAQDIDTFTQNLGSEYGISLDDLYEDFIASNNAERIEKAERITDFIKAGQGLKDAMKDHFGTNLNPYAALSQSAIAKMFGSEDIALLPFTLGVNAFNGDEDSEGWSEELILFSSGLNLFKDGRIAPQDCTDETGDTCTLYEPTWANILANLEHYLSYWGHTNDSLISDVSIYNISREVRGYQMDVNVDTGDMLQCEFEARMEFREQKVCDNDGCPDELELEKTIVHNIGFPYPSECTPLNSPFLYAFVTEKHNWADTNASGYGQEIFDVQYILNESSTIYSDPPLEFLGSDRSSIDYIETFNKISSLFVDMDSISNAEVNLTSGEFLAISRTLFDNNDIETARYDYVLDPERQVCRESSWGGTGFVVDNETEGVQAFSACYELIQGFTFFD